MTQNRVSFRQKKNFAREMLEKRAMDEMKKWAESERGALRVLVSLLYDRDKVICYRAAEALGIVAAVMIAQNPESIRELLRRLFWSMNDESGNLCWYAPEAIGEILYNVPSLCSEFCGILASFLVEEPFEKGTRLAISRIATADQEVFCPFGDKIAASLDNPDPGICGASLMALDVLDAEIDIDKVKRLESNTETLDIYNYEKGEMDIVSIGSLASKYLKKQ